MRAIDIALKDLRIIVRDWKALALILAMPLILILILGAALGGAFAQGDSLFAFQVAVVDLDGGHVSSQFMELMSSPRLSELIKTVPAETEDEALDMVRAGKAACAVIIPSDASDFASMTTKTIKVFSDPARAISGQVVAGIVATFAEQYSAVASGVRNIVSSFSAVPHSGQSSPVAPAGLTGLIQKVQERLLSETLRAAGLFSSTEEKPNWITSTQYYTASMTVMFVLFGAMLGAKSIIEEKSQKTMARLFSTRATRTDIVVGKTLATYLLSVLQILVLVAFTSVVYRTNWGDMRGVVIVTAALSLAATGLVMLIAAISKTEKVADALENFGVQIMAFLGGCQVPIYLFPSVMQTISRATPTRWGLDGYLMLMQGRSWTSVGQPVAVLSLMGLVFLVAGVWRLDLD